MKTIYKVNERVVALHNGKHGWVSEVKYVEPEPHCNINYDHAAPNGTSGAFLPWSLMRPETFFEYLFMRRGYFGKWSTGQAAMVYGLLGIVAYAGHRTATYFEQPEAGIAILAFVALMVIGSILLHRRNHRGKQA